MVLNWTWPLFRIFGIRVSMHWMLALLTGIYLVQALSTGSGEVILVVAVACLVLAASVLFHELAHCWMAIRRGGSADEIVLGPLGGVSYVGHTGSTADEIAIAGVGPLSNFLLAGAAFGGFALTGAAWDWSLLNPFGGWLPTGFTLAQVMLLNAGWINLSLGLFNLLVPAYPLDGGRILYAFLTARHGRARGAEISAAISLPVGLAIAIWGFATWQILLAVIGVAVLFDALQLRRLAKMGELDAHPAFSGPEFDPAPERTRKPGFFSRWRARRAEARRRREAGRLEEEQQRVDAVLEKVSRDGIGSLSSSERRILEEASKRRRG